MKKAALIFGVIGISIILLGALFKIMHWPGAGILIIWGTIFDLIIVMPVIAIFTLSKESPNRSLYFYGSLSAFLWLAGSFFKMQHWPASGILLSVGTLMLIIFLILFAVELNKKL